MPLCFEFCFFWGWLRSRGSPHAVQVTLQGIQVYGPEPAELSQPHIHLLEGFRIEAVKPPLSVHDGLHETCFPQHAQMLRYGGLGHA